ncbi:hypothetical protein HNP69_002040 [Chryseobacterium koreense]|nr:hypothetical protein [Chryseobacterium koreense]
MNNWFFNGKILNFAESSEYYSTAKKEESCLMAGFVISLLMFVGIIMNDF